MKLFESGLSMEKNTYVLLSLFFLLTDWLSHLHYEHV